MAFDRAAFALLYPFESHYLDRGGLAYHYLDEGRGDPVIMLHGNPTWSFYYRNLVKSLRDSYRAIVPDHMGCGLSDKPGDTRYSYTLDRRVDDLEALLDHLDVKKELTLVLHDWGGGIGMAFASRHPERIKRLVILNTSAFLLPPGKTFPWALWIARNLKLGSFLVRGFNAFSSIATRVAAAKPMPKAIRRAYTAPYDSWQNRIATLRFVQDIPLRPGDPVYATMKGVQDGLERFASIPMMICWGEKDFVFDHHFLKQWRNSFPDAEVHTFSDAGHYVLEDAGDRIIPLILHFLEEHPLVRAVA